MATAPSQPPPVCMYSLSGLNIPSDLMLRFPGLSIAGERRETGVERTARGEVGRIRAQAGAYPPTSELEPSGSKRVRPWTTRDPPPRFTWVHRFTPRFQFGCMTADLPLSAAFVIDNESGPLCAAANQRFSARRHGYALSVGSPTARAGLWAHRRADGQDLVFEARAGAETRT